MQAVQPLKTQAWVWIPIGQFSKRGLTFGVLKKKKKEKKKLIPVFLLNVLLNSSPWKYFWNWIQYLDLETKVSVLVMRK